MAKRSCRRTMDENKIHEKAVKMRKMTDEQLVQYVEDRVEKARAEERNKAKRPEVPKEPVKTVADYLAFISQNPVKGVGVATVSKLIKVAKENGFCA